MKEEQVKLDIPALGAPFAGGFFGGEYVLDGQRFALVVAPKAEGEKLDVPYKAKNFGAADGTDSDDDGVINCVRINDADHPAAEFCLDLSIGGFTDWFLPSRDELAVLCRNLGPTRKKTPEPFRSGDSEAFAERWHWSSTEFASYSGYAWVVDFSVVARATTVSTTTTRFGQSAD
ncbi:MAG: DUF1566 domain-containing protein [Oryzomonas sp.]|jgi:hypothetical protein